MIKTILIDDEPIAVKHLAAMIGKYNTELSVVSTADSLDEALEQIHIYKPEVVFMDIELGGHSAFDVLTKSCYKDFELIFVSAHNQFGISAVKHGAVDYLLKPLNKVELIHAMDKVVKKSLAKRALQMASISAEILKPAPDRITIPTMEGLIFIDMDKIMYCSADGRYTRFFTSPENKSLLVSKNLGEYETILPAGTFIRIHHHFIVNIKYIEKYVKGRGGYVVLKDGKSLPVSSRKKDWFFSKFG